MITNRFHYGFAMLPIWSFEERSCNAVCKVDGLALIELFEC